MATHKFAIDKKVFEVEVGFRRGNRVDVTVNGKVYEVELESTATASRIRSTPIPTAAVAPASMPATAPAPAPAAAPRASSATAAAGAVVAPLAGLVLSVKAKVGQEVKAGDELVVLEAMKMENAITAPQDGTVKHVAVQPQQTVAQGDLLVELG